MKQSQELADKISLSLDCIYSYVSVMDRVGTREQQGMIREARYHLEKAKSIVDALWPLSEIEKDESSTRCLNAETR